MRTEYFFLYLIYGLVFISMGIFISYQRDKEVNHLPLVKSLKYLGGFGLTHGLSEWVTMVVIADLYPGSYVYFFIIKQFLKAISFVFLMTFGATLLPKGTIYRSIANKIPFILFIFWGSGFYYLIRQYGLNYHILNPQYNIILLRYFMGLPAGLITAFALNQQVKVLKNRKLNIIAQKYKHLAAIFLVYGLVDGLIVREMEFFPANIINNQLFLQWLGFPIQIVKIIVGVGINLLLIRVIETFGWEQKEKLKQLQQQRIADEERRKLGLEIHDSIIQSMYGASLKLQCLITNNKGEEEQNELLREIKSELGDTIKKTRMFISKTTLKTVELEDLKGDLEKLVKVFNDNQNIEISLKSQMDLSNSIQLPAEKSSQIYYIVQEAISNVVKHSEASRAEILLDCQYDFLNIKVIDNGIGICFDNACSKRQFGIDSMKERAKHTEGILKIQKLKQGTMVELMVPWGEEENAK